MAVASEVINMRVLAVRASPPEVQLPVDGGFSVTQLDALVVGADGVVHYTWDLCLAPGVPTEESACFVPEGLLPLGNGPEATVPIPSVEEVLASAPELTDLNYELDFSEGVEVQVELEVEDDSGRIVKAIKGVTVSERADTNENPTLTGLSVDGLVLEGAPFTVQADTELEVVPVWPAAALQTWTDTDGEQQTEEALFSWFLDEEDAMFRQERSSDRFPDNTWTPGGFADDDDRDQRQVTLWLVMRDGRGGVTWLEQPFLVQRPEADE